MNQQNVQYLKKNNRKYKKHNADKKDTDIFFYGIPPNKQPNDTALYKPSYWTKSYEIPAYGSQR